MLNGCIYIELLSKVLYDLPLIHTHTLTHQWQQATMKGAGQPSGAMWGSVSCPRTLPYVDGNPALAPEPQPPEKRRRGDKRKGKEGKERRQDMKEKYVQERREKEKRSLPHWNN